MCKQKVIASEWVCVCVFVFCLCVWRNLNAAEIWALFFLCLFQCECVCVCLCLRARVCWFFFLYFLHTTFWTSLTWKNYSKASTDDDDSTRSSALFVVRKVYNNFITFSQSDSDLKFGYSEMGTRRSCCTFSFKFGDSNRRREEERRLLRQLCL